MYRVRNDTAVEQVVEIGQRTDLEAEVIAGLDEGDRVVIHPSDEVLDGVTVAAPAR